MLRGSRGGLGPAGRQHLSVLLGFGKSRAEWACHQGPSGQLIVLYLWASSGSNRFSASSFSSDGQVSRAVRFSSAQVNRDIDFGGREALPPPARPPLTPGSATPTPWHCPVLLVLPG